IGHAEAPASAFWVPQGAHFPTGARKLSKRRIDCLGAQLGCRGTHPATDCQFTIEELPAEYQRRDAQDIFIVISSGAFECDDFRVAQYTQSPGPILAHQSEGAYAVTLVVRRRLAVVVEIIAIQTGQARGPIPVEFCG